MATQKLTWNKLDLSAIDIAPSFYRFVQQMDWAQTVKHTDKQIKYTLLYMQRFCVECSINFFREFSFWKPLIDNKGKHAIPNYEGRHIN